VHYINIHHYAPPTGSTAQRAAGSGGHRAAMSLAAAGRCGVSEGSTSSFKSKVHEKNFANYS